MSLWLLWLLLFFCGDGGANVTNGINVVVVSILFGGYGVDSTNVVAFVLANIYCAVVIESIKVYFRPILFHLTHVF